MSESAQAELQRVLSELREAIKRSGKRYREIEQVMGLSTGYLVHLLSGSREMRVRQFIEVCEAIELSPATLFLQEANEGQ